MKQFCIILMVVGALLAFLGTGGGGVEVTVVFAIFGSTLFGSGVIALAITQACEKKS